MHHDHSIYTFDRVRGAKRFLIVALAGLLAACTSLGASGPSSRAVMSAAKKPQPDAAIHVIELTDAVARRVMAVDAATPFSELAGSKLATDRLVGRGDTLEITIWEAPPAALFATGLSDPRGPMVSNSVARGGTFPETVVDSNGRINLPFVGSVMVAGRSTTQLEHEIAARLVGQAHQPQAVVRLSRNAAATVTVVGDVTASTRMPLTSKGERLLDALAAAGGTKQSVGKTTIQLTRGTTVATLPLQTVIRDPAQNVILQPNDVVTALFQPYSFTALGAISTNAEIPFEGGGITVAQALGRMGGLRDERADVRGVFIFRLAKHEEVGDLVPAGSPTTPDGKIPVIYRLSLKEPNGFFVAQSFPIRDHDVVYVSNAPLADIQKFVNVVTNLTYSIVGIKNGL